MSAGRDLGPWQGPVPGEVMDKVLGKVVDMAQMAHTTRKRITFCVLLLYLTTVVICDAFIGVCLGSMLVSSGVVGALLRRHMPSSPRCYWV